MTGIDPHSPTTPTSTARFVDVVTVDDLPGAVSWARTSRGIRLNQIVPFILLGLLALLLASFPATDHHRGTWLWATGGLLVAAGIQMVLMPWHRLHPLWRHLPVITFCTAIVLLREIDTQGTTGFGVLLLLPIIWQAVYGRRIDLALAFAQITAALVVPMFALDGYPVRQEVPRTILILSMAAALGAVMKSVIGRVRDHDRTMKTFVAVSRRLHNTDDPLGFFAAGMRVLTQSDSVTVLQRAGHGQRGLHEVATARRGSHPLQSSLEFPADTPTLDTAVTWSLEPFLDRSEATFERRPVNLAQPSAQWPGDVAARLIVPIGNFGDPIGLAVATWAREPRRPSTFEHNALVMLGVDVGRAMDRFNLLGTLDDQAHRDELTGLPNRRAWDDLIEHEISNARHLHRDLAVAVLDLDHFKRYNDTHGHLAGDDLLRRAAHHWSDGLRDNDILARWGGEEFVAALPGTTLEEAEKVLQRLRVMTPDGQTFSAGITLLTPGDDADSVVAAADDALYEAKTSGRDRVVSHRR